MHPFLHAVKSVWGDNDSWSWGITSFCPDLCELHCVRWPSVTSEMNIHERRQNDALSVFTVRVCHMGGMEEACWFLCVLWDFIRPTLQSEKLSYVQQLPINFHQRPWEDRSCCFKTRSQKLYNKTLEKCLGFKEIESRYSLVTNKTYLADLSKPALKAETVDEKNLNNNYKFCLMMALWTA